MTPRSKISEKNQKVQEPFRLQDATKRRCNDSMLTRHLLLQKTTLDSLEEESKKCRGRMKRVEVELVDEKTDKSAVARWFFFSVPEEIRTSRLEF